MTELFRTFFIDNGTEYPFMTNGFDDYQLKFETVSFNNLGVDQTERYLELVSTMEKDGTDHVWLSMENIDKNTILEHFPNICERCREEGYDVTKEWIPVVPAQHYFMGGIKVDHESRTTMDNLYAIGETACNGVHGRNRLASNSLLESLVFAKRAALDITENAVVKPTQDEITYFDTFDAEKYADESKIDGEYAELVNKKIEEADKAYEESQKKNYA